MAQETPAEIREPPCFQWMLGLQVLEPALGSGDVGAAELGGEQGPGLWAQRLPLAVKVGSNHLEQPRSLGEAGVQQPDPAPEHQATQSSVSLHRKGGAGCLRPSLWRLP